LSTVASPPIDRRPFNGLKVEDEDLDGLGQKSCNGLEAIELYVGRPWEFDTWRGDKTTASKSSDGLEAAPMDWRPVAAWSSNPSAWHEGVRGRLWQLQLKTTTQATKPW